MNNRTASPSELEGSSLAGGSRSREVERFEGTMFGVEYVVGPDEYARKPGSYVTIYIDEPYEAHWETGSRQVVIERSLVGLPAAAVEAPFSAEDVNPPPSSVDGLVERLEVLRNALLPHYSPPLEEAAQALTSLASEISQLREALREIASRTSSYAEDWSSYPLAAGIHGTAKAALPQESE